MRLVGQGPTKHRVKNPEGSIFIPFTFIKEGAGFFCFQWPSAICIILIKGERKEKKTEKKKVRTVPSQIRKVLLTGCNWAFQILEIPVKNWSWKGSQKYTVCLP
jgi:hypothetical protein